LKVKYTHFSEFMRERNIFDEYNKFRYFYVQEKLSDFLKRTDPKNYILDAFRWKRFSKIDWEKLNDDWNKKVKEIHESN